MSLSKKKILILMSGSIAAYKICSLVSQLMQNNFEVEVAMTEAATHFVGPATIEGLTGKAPHVGLFTSGSAMEHIHLQRWADLILVAPATANTINKMAAGFGDDLISTLFLAHDFKKPFLIAPAMNTQMYMHPTTQASVKRLTEMGFKILESASGVLACGEVGVGRLLEPHLLFQEIQTALSQSFPQGTSENAFKNTTTGSGSKKILITSGGTEEAIDDVRTITNHSTGKTGATIADQLIDAGYEVFYLSARTAQKPKLNCDQAEFTSFKSLKEKLEALLKTFKFDFVIHAAAVSDFSPEKTQGKIDSSVNSINLVLTRNPKLINSIKVISPTSQLVGFKLTSELTAEKVQKKVSGLFTDAHCDYVVHNDWKTIQNGNHQFHIYKKNENQIYKNANGAKDLALNLLSIVSENI